MTSLRSCSVPHRTLLIALLLSSAALLFLSASTFAAEPAPGVQTGENAYCGKGDVAHFGDKDGPAELPQTCYYTGLDGTPSPGKQIHVGEKDDLAGAVSSAKCGDILLLPPGAVYEVRELAPKKCDDQHYITIRSDVPDSKLPPEGTRISPAWAGVASLPGRPPFAQPTGGPAKLMATIMVKPNNGVRRRSHSFHRDRMDHSRERSHQPHGLHRSCRSRHFRPQLHARRRRIRGGTRRWHDSRQPQNRGHQLVLSGLNCIARKGSCTDATAIGGAHSDEPFGTFKIYNNFLEASGEDILLGGGGRRITRPTWKSATTICFVP